MAKIPHYDPETDFEALLAAEAEAELDDELQVEFE